MKKNLALLVLAFALAGCQTAGVLVKPDVLKEKTTALDEQVLSGKTTPEKILPQYEDLYDAHKKEPIAIAAYADALRRAHEPKEAALLLKPEIKDKPILSIPEPVFLAYSRLILDQGYFADAEKRLLARLMKSSDSPAQLNNLLGISLAGQHRRAEAEQAFRRALEAWDGRPGVVEKNLARLQAK